MQKSQKDNVEAENRLEGLVMALSGFLAIMNLLNFIVVDVSLLCEAEFDVIHSNSARSLACKGVSECQ